jgi:hypothetical protein
MLSVFLWQWATVGANYGGNWSALFCTGSLRGIPPSLSAEHIYQFQDSNGFDGSLYHYIAHDPLMRNPELKAYVDAPRYRYRRILVPGIAWLAALGRSQWIDSAYVSVCLLWIGLGVFWASKVCLSLSAPAAGGLLFVFFPAVLVSVDRMVTDVALAALAVGFVLYSTQSSWRLILVLVAAALARETGFFLLAGYCGYLLLERRWMRALRYAGAGIPAALWYLYVQTHTEAYAPFVSAIPLATLRAAVTTPISYPAWVPLVPVLRVADMLVIAGLVLGLVLAWFLIVRRCYRPECLAGFCFGLLGIFFFPQHVYDSGRIYTPLLVFLAVQGLRRRSVLWFVPWLTQVPRVGMQMAPQVFGVAGTVRQHFG